MTTHDTRSQLLAGIAAHPDDDTPRLVFADWLDERGDQPDDALRAEFIRVQCALDQLSGCNPVCSQEEGHRDDCRYGDAGESLCRRADELLAAHPEWSRCRCPKMAERMWGPSDPRGCAPCCSTCGGTGDLFTEQIGSRPRTVTFARGFPDAVTCTLAEAFKTDGTPTPWAVAVVRQTPVTRFVMTDVDEPGRDSGDRKYPFHWRGTMFTHNVGYTIADLCNKNYWTVERAVDVLALAAGRVVRRHAYKERT